MTENKLEVGSLAPDFTLKNADGQELSLKQFRGKWVVLYFYPKDNTPGCTTEALDFTALKEEFENANAVILGISPDTCESHQKFMQKHHLNIILLSDPEHTVLNKYGVWQLKKRYGREYMGVVRTTFLIDPEGGIRHVWHNVKVKGHAAEVLDKIKALQ